MNTQFNITSLPDGSLAPHPQGEGVASISYKNDPISGMTAIVAFAGVNQAVLNFDANGQRVVSYFPYNHANNRSIENIICWLNSHPMQYGVAH